MDQSAERLNQTNGVNNGLFCLKEPSRTVREIYLENKQGAVAPSLLLPISNF